MVKKEMIEELKKRSPRAAGFTKEELNKIEFRIGADNKGTWIHPITGSEYFIDFGTTNDLEILERLRLSNMPKEYIEMSIDEFDWNTYKEDITECKNICNQYILKFENMIREGTGLYIVSRQKGSGKTMLSCMIIKALCKKFPEHSYKFVTVTDYINAMKDSYKTYDNSQIEKYKECALLVIDDIGVQGSKDWIETEFYGLVNTRHNKKLPTIYTSNLPVNGLNMDDRTKARIEDDSIVIALPEESIRHIKSEERKRKLLQGND